jgi:hypothetical protein
MLTVRIVEALNEPEDGHRRFGVRLKAMSIKGLTSSGEETLGYRVVVGVSDRTHRGTITCLSTAFDELDRKYIVTRLRVVVEPARLSCKRAMALARI